MARSATNELERVGGDYCRLYLPARLARDSAFPFRPGDGVRVEIVETTCEREVLVITPDALEVDVDATALAVGRSSREVQTALDEGVTESA